MFTVDHHLRNLPPDARGRLEQIILQFESAWGRGGRPEITDQLPQDPTERRVVLVELVYTELELRLKAGESARVEDYLSRFPDLASDKKLVLDLLATEYRLRRAAPELTSEEILGRFPQLASELDKYFREGAPPGIEQQTISREPATIGDRKSPDPLLPSVPNYEVLGELGRGGMGIIYKARQMGLNRLVALKMVGRDGPINEELLARFRLEAEAVAQLQHPGIVQVYEIGETEAGPFFSLEYVEGGSLAGHLDGAPWLSRRAAQLVERLAWAIHSAHQKGIIHRDLKPANILLAPSDHPGAVPVGSRPEDSLRFEPKITDFGLAKQLNQGRDPTQSGALIGTPCYMAPEQARGRSQAVPLGPAVDIYALGAILYEMLTGRPPFQGNTTWEVIAQVLSSDPEPPTRLQPKVHRDLETICLKCLEKESRKRYGSALELAEELRRFLASEPILARPVGRFGRVRKWIKRRPITAGLGVFALFLMITGTLLLGGVNRPEGKRLVGTDKGEAGGEPFGSPEDLTAPGARGAAAMILKEEKEAKKRCAAIRFLATKEFHRFPEAEAALIASLRADRIESVRLEAARALGNENCWTPRTVMALKIAAVGTDEDMNFTETSPKVRAAAQASLEKCKKLFNGKIPDREDFHKRWPRLWPKSGSRPIPAPHPQLPAAPPSKIKQI